MIAKLEFDFEKTFTEHLVVRAQGTIGFDKQVVCLTGPSGAGKTTFIRWVAGLGARPNHDGPSRKLYPTEFLRFEESIWADAAANIFVGPEHRRIGYVPQDEKLFPHLSVVENIRYGLRRLPRSRASTRTGELIEFLELGRWMNHRPDELSGGLKKRVALARAMAPHPRLLLLDEPFSSLDFAAREKLVPRFREWLEDFSTPSLIITHDPREVALLGAPVIEFSIEHGESGDSDSDSHEEISPVLNSPDNDNPNKLTNL